MTCFFPNLPRMPFDCPLIYHLCYYVVRLISVGVFLTLLFGRVKIVSSLFHCPLSGYLYKILWWYFHFNSFSFTLFLILFIWSFLYFCVYGSVSLLCCYWFELSMHFLYLCCFVMFIFNRKHIAFSFQILFNINSHNLNVN